MKKRELFFIAFLSMFIFFSANLTAQEELNEFDLKVKNWTVSCAGQVREQMELLVSTGKISLGQVFDTFYIPIPNTSPQKYNTQYDKYTDEVIRGILDNYLKKDEKLIFVIAVDKNGYLPTHNTKYCQPLTGDMAKDAKRNRTKRIFNDRTGLAASRNTKSYLLQVYKRDTGEKMADLSVPIYIKGRHWGALRIGYKRDI